MCLKNSFFFLTTFVICMYLKHAKNYRYELDEILLCCTISHSLQQIRKTYFILWLKNEYIGAQGEELVNSELTNAYCFLLFYSAGM